MSVRTLPGGALVVWPETLSQTPWLINKSAGGPPFFEIFPEIICLVFHNISHDIYQFIDVKYFVFYDVIYFTMTVFHSKSHDV